MCGREFKRPLHRLVRQLRSSSLDPTTLGRKVQKRCARQKFFWIWTFRFFGTCGLSVAVCERNRTLALLLFNRNRTRRERFFRPNLRHHNHQRLPSATIRKRKENCARLFTFWHRIKKPFRRKGVRPCGVRIFHFAVWRKLVVWNTQVEMDGVGRWEGLKDGPVRQSQERDIYERIGWKAYTNLYNSKIGRYEDRKRLRRLWLSFTTKLPSLRRKIYRELSGARWVWPA